MKKIVSHSVAVQLSRPIKTGIILTVALMMGVAALIPAWQSKVLADEFDDQINALQAQNASNRSTLDQLADRAESYQDAIEKLQNQINALVASINLNKQRQADLQRQIDEAQAEIDRQRAILAVDIKAMYVDGTPSSLEMLAASKNLSDFVDKQEYRSRVQQNIQNSLETIAELQRQLQEQKAKIEVLIKDMQQQQAAVDSQRAEQQQLLNYNQAEQDAYNSKIQENNAKVASLRTAQAAANAQINGQLVSNGVCGGGYPAQAQNSWGASWGCNYPLDNTIDLWGMYNRECVSYTAFKVYQTYGYMPYWGGHGNANQWPANARAAGIPTSSKPRVGSVATWYTGYYGHVMWVEAVNADGSIVVSQYNYSWDGKYSVMKVSAAMAASFTYIYFDQM